MKNLISYDDFLNEELNEELNIKKALTGAALGASLLMGSPDVKGQEKIIPDTDKTEIVKKNQKVDLTDKQFRKWKYDNMFNKDYKPISYKDWVINQIGIPGTKDMANIDTIAYNAIIREITPTKPISTPTPNSSPVILLSHDHITPGDYLVKGTNQLLAGIGISVIGAGVTLISTQTDDPNLSKPLAITGLLLGIVGTGFEISGILNIQKAGLSLNQNGIGLRIPIK